MQEFWKKLTMDFEEIYQTFKKQAQAQFTESAFLDSDATETGTIQIEISEITEGLFRIKEKSCESGYK